MLIICILSSFLPRRRREGRIKCPALGCSSQPYSHQVLAAHLSQESFDVKLVCSYDKDSWAKVYRFQSSKYLLSRWSCDSSPFCLFSVRVLNTSFPLVVICTQRCLKQSVICMDCNQVFASAKAAIVSKRRTCHSRRSCRNHVVYRALDSRTHGYPS